MSKYPQNMLFWRYEYQGGSIVEKSLKDSLTQGRMTSKLGILACPTKHTYGIDNSDSA